MISRIALDAMGGDNAPAAVVEGAYLAAANEDIEIILVGKEDAIRAELDKYTVRTNISILNAEEVIENEDEPVRAARRKKESSMVKAVNLVKEGKADAALSAGNTGALMASALLYLGRIKGVERPAIVSVFPHLTDRGFSLLVDAGANAECRAEHLLCFAKMASIYMQDAFDIERPTVGLINIGTEEGKGTPMLKEVYAQLKQSDLNFVGNVESRELPKGPADVLVCDGFTGNIILKLYEGTAWNILKLFKSKVKESPIAMMGGALMSGQLKSLKGMFDYASYGAAPILGTDGLVFKMHGSASAHMTHLAIVKAAEVAQKNPIAKIAAAMEKPAETTDAEA
ncbi:MAG: phosphate acyltransferase PlsX [Firmicutes bacterium]|nr:phosphate acyltransferase PlsX [Bacillota bacterium]